MLYTIRTFPVEYEITDADVAFIGIPFDSTATHRHSKHSPLFFRYYIRSLEGFDMETGIDIFEKIKFCDAGDIDVVEGSWELTFERVRDTVKYIMGKNPRILPFFVGGDHSITLATIKSLKEIYKEMTVVQFDAHPDLYKQWKGSKISHATWAYNLLKEKNIELVQIGCRSISKSELHLWKKTKKEIGVTDRPVYVTVDMDVLDISAAGEAASPEPHGMSLEELYSLLKNICRNRIAGFDIVEFSSRSIDDNAHIIACNIMKKMLGYIWSEKNRG